MGYTIELESDDLSCKSEADAEAAAKLIVDDEWIHPYHLQVSPVCRSNPPDDINWSLDVDHFQGDHWHEDQARRVWLAIAPHMADGATIEFQGEGRERWRVRWQWDDCEVCRNDEARRTCDRCHGLGGFARVFEEYITDIIWAVTEQITPDNAPLLRGTEA